MFRIENFKNFINIHYSGGRDEGSCGRINFNSEKENHIINLKKIVMSTQNQNQQRNPQNQQTNQQRNPQNRPQNQRRPEEEEE